jgi:hypothetical protein
VGRARTAAKEAGITDTKALVDDYVKSEAFQKSTKVDKAWRDGVSANYREAVSHTEAASARRTKAQEYREQADEVMRLAASGKIDWTPEWHNYLVENALNNDRVDKAYQVTNLGQVTGDIAAFWMNKFFSEAHFGRNLHGEMALLSPDGTPGPNKQPLQPRTHSPESLDKDHLDRTLTLGGTTVVTPGSVKHQHDVDKGKVPKATVGDPTTMGLGVRRDVEGAPAVVQSAERGARIKQDAAEAAARAKVAEKVGDISLKTKAFGGSDVPKEASEAAGQPLMGDRNK